MCDHVIGMSILAEMRGLFTLSETTRHIAAARADLLDDADRQVDKEKVRAMSDAELLEASSDLFAHCPRCGANLQQS